MIDNLEQQVKEGTIDGQYSLCVDEMVIQKGLVYDHSDGRFVGHVNLGAGDVDDPSHERSADQVTSCVTSELCLTR